MQYNLKFDVPIQRIEKARQLTKIGMGQFLLFGKGSFDDWTPYVATVMTDGSVMCSYPSDKHYFEIAAGLANGHGPDKVYDDVRYLYARCGKEFDPALAAELAKISLTYGRDHEWAYNMLMHAYFGMLSEENKPGTALGRSLKMNGFYSFLRAGRPFDAAADECRGRSWQEIRDECLSRGICRF